MGLFVDVYRSSLGDATMGGISSKADRLLILNVEGPFEPGPNTVNALLVKGNAPGYIKIVPAVYDITQLKYVPEPQWCMMGGNYATTSDVRFNRAVEALVGVSYGAVPVHDRVE